MEILSLGCNLRPGTTGAAGSSETRASARRSRLALGISLLAFGATAMPLYAADPPASANQATDQEPLETIVVTGSRISRPDYNAESPISTLSSAAINAASQPSEAGIASWTISTTSSPRARSTAMFRVDP